MFVLSLVPTSFQSAGLTSWANAFDWFVSSNASVDASAPAPPAFKKLLRESSM